jgi:hypothetical protein
VQFYASVSCWRVDDPVRAARLECRSCLKGSDRCGGSPAGAQVPRRVGLRPPPRLSRQAGRAPRRGGFWAGGPRVALPRGDPRLIAWDGRARGAAVALMCRVIPRGSSSIRSHRGWFLTQHSLTLPFTKPRANSANSDCMAAIQRSR